MSSADKLPEMLAFLRRRRPAMLRLLKRFVLCESPTDARSAVDHFGRVVAAEWEKRGAKVEFLRPRRAGNHVRVVWPQIPARRSAFSARSGQILVLGHLDTVYELGTIRRMPFRVSRG